MHNQDQEYQDKSCANFYEYIQKENTRIAQPKTPLLPANGCPSENVISASGEVARPSGDQSHKPRVSLR